MDAKSQRIAIAKSAEQRKLTRAVEQLLGICNGLIADGHIHPTEVQFLSTWLSNNPGVVSAWPGNVIAERVRNIMADGVITADERLNLLETLLSIGAGDFSQSGAAEMEVALPLHSNPEFTFEGSTFCFTGRFYYGTRAACERTVLKLGATAVDGVTRDLDYLIVGGMVEPSWAHSSFGRKIEKAMQLCSNGAPLIMASEKDWHQALQTHTS